MDMSWLKQTQSADEYLQHAYEIPAELPVLPLTDEPFAARWREVQGGAGFSHRGAEAGGL